jgi:hypothetical protein
MVLLRVPIRIETATSQTPFRNRAPIRGAEIKASHHRNANEVGRAVHTPSPRQAVAIDIRAKFGTFHPAVQFFCWITPGSFRLLQGTAE